AWLTQRGGPAGRRAPLPRQPLPQTMEGAMSLFPAGMSTPADGPVSSLHSELGPAAAQGRAEQQVLGAASAAGRDPAVELVANATIGAAAEDFEVTIVLPCLNEEAAIGLCLERLQEVITREGLRAEIVVVDNASTDRSAAIARAHGARVIYQPER